MSLPFCRTVISLARPESWPRIAMIGYSHHTIIHNIHCGSEPQLVQLFLHQNRFGIRMRVVHQPLTNHGAGCITSPARSGKGLLRGRVRNGIKLTKRAVTLRVARYSGKQLLYLSVRYS